MILEDKYPNAFQFFVGYFPEADMENKTDQQVVEEFCSDNPKKLLIKTKKELIALSEDSSLWETISIEANRHFNESEEMAAWLGMILLELQENMEE